MTEEINKMTLRLPIDLNKAFEERAKAEMISKNALIVRACRELLRQLEHKKKGECL